MNPIDPTKEQLANRLDAIPQAEQQTMANQNPEQYNNVADAAGYATYAYPGGPNLGAVSKIPSVLPVSSLQNTPSVPTFPPEQPKTAASALGGTIEGMTNSPANTPPPQPTAQPTQEQAPEDSKMQQYADKLLATYQKLTGKSARNVALNQEQGVDEKTKLVTSLTNQLNAKQQAVRKQIEAVRNQPGVPLEIINRQIQDIERKGNSELADIAIQQNAANDDLSTAMSIVKQKLDVEFEADEKNYERLKELYPIFKDQLDRKDKDYEKKLDAKIAELKDFKDFKQKAYETLISSGGGADANALNALGKATNEDEVARALGSYGTSTTGSIGEYSFAKRNGYTGSFTDYQNEDANRKKSIAAAGVAGQLSPAQVTSSFKLADDYDKASGNFDKVVDGYNRVVASAANPSAAGDLALIFNYMKVLDPGSTVREGEFATAQNAGSVPDRIVAQYNKIINGERLSDSQRTDFVSRADGLYKTALEQQKKTDQQYSERAKKYGIDPNYVIRDRSAISNTETSIPKNSTLMTGPDGKPYHVPNEKVDAFIKAGGKKI